jgi:hypothetical protein
MKKEIERVAEIQHNDIWSHWMKYMFTQGELDKEGNWIIPKEKVERWKRQMNTPYVDLTEKEKESDREQAKKVVVEKERCWHSYQAIEDKKGFEECLKCGHVKEEKFKIR